MNLLNMLEGKEKTVRPEEVSALIGKAWVKADKSFEVAPLTNPVEGKKGEYEISGVYPLIVTDYCRISFGVNSKCDSSKNQNTHWCFLKVEKARIEEYTALLAKIGQGVPETK